MDTSIDIMLFIYILWRFRRLFKLVNFSYIQFQQKRFSNINVLLNKKIEILTLHVMNKQACYQLFNSGGRVLRMHVGFCHGLTTSYEYKWHFI